MATIIDALENAEFNMGQLVTKMPGMIQAVVALSQIRNARVLLEKGYDIHTDINDVLKAHEDVDDVPEKEADDEDQT